MTSFLQSGLTIEVIIVTVLAQLGTCGSFELVL